MAHKRWWSAKIVMASFSCYLTEPLLPGEGVLGQYGHRWVFETPTLVLSTRLAAHKRSFLNLLRKIAAEWPRSIGGVFCDIQRACERAWNWQRAMSHLFIYRISSLLSPNFGYDRKPNKLFNKASFNEKLWEISSFLLCLFRTKGFGGSQLPFPLKPVQSTFTAALGRSLDLREKAMISDDSLVMSWLPWVPLTPLSRSQKTRLG